MQKTIKFLKELKSNNNRDWFTANKEQYQASMDEVKAFVACLNEQMNTHDQIEGTAKIYRIYRDVRFSTDKIPYKVSWNGSFRRATAHLRGGYYFHLEPGNTFIAGGFFGPNPQDLLHIRKQIAQEPEPLRAILNAKSFKNYFGTLTGEQVKTAPKGFSKDDPDLDLLRFKQFIIRHSFTDQQILAPGFDKTMSSGFQKMRPFFDYMSGILTTDLNGIPLV